MFNTLKRLTKQKSLVKGDLSKTATALKEAAQDGENEKHEGLVIAKDGTILSTLSAQQLLAKASKTGYAQKVGGSVKSWKKRFFILVENYLFYFKDDSSSEALGVVIVESSEAVARADAELQKENSFKIVTAKRTMYICCDSEYAAESWIYALKMSNSILSDHVSHAKIKGWMSKKSKDGNSWKERFCCVDDGVLYLYKTNTDPVPSKEVPLTGCIAKRADNENEHRECLKITYSTLQGQTNTSNEDAMAQMKNIVLCSEDDDIEIWKTVIEREAEENAGTLQSQSVFKGWLGMLKQTEKNAKGVWVAKYFVLYIDKLLIFEDETALISEGSILLTGRMIARADAELNIPNTFRIATSDDSLYLAAQQDDEADCWVDVLKRVCRTRKVQEYEKSGWLTKQGGSIKTWKKRWCVLKGSQLYYYGQKTDAEPKGSVELQGQMVRHLSREDGLQEVEKENVVKVFTPSRTYYMVAETEQDVIEWCVVLRKAALLFNGKTIVVDCSIDKAKKDGKFATIAEACVKASPLDRILVQEGVYAENLTIKKPLILEGVGDVRIESKQATPILFNCTASKLSNISVRQLGTKDLNGINIEKGNIFLSNCDVSSNGGNCINVQEEAQLTLNNCKIHSGKMYGIWFNGKASGLLENNEICGNGWDGIMLMSHSDLVCRSTKVFGNSYNGIAISTNGRIYIEHCTLSDNKWDGITVSTQDAYCKFYDNQITKNGGYGIYYSKSNPTLQVENQIFDNKKGNVSK